MPEKETKILCVDDEPANLHLYEALLSRYMPHAQVRTATDGESGLAAVHADHPDIILLDARMPRMDGFEMCRQLKTNPNTSHIPVLMISGAYVEPHHRLSGFEGGADGYLCKPIKTQELATQIKALLLIKQRKDVAFRTMIVDDSEISQHVIMAEVKRSPDVEVAVFETAQAALSALDAVKPDIVIFDYEMTDMDGLTFASTLRAQSLYENTPCVLLAEHPDDKLRTQIQDLDHVQLLRKPFAPNALHRFVNQYIDSRREWFDHEVLVVDESQITRSMLKQDLSGMRLRVHEAAEARTAQGILENNPIDLIILDDALPEKTGLQWCEELRDNKEYRWIPILGLSADDSMSLSFIRAGADDYLSKTLIKEEIVIRVRNLLKRVTLTNQLNAAVQRERDLNEHKKKLLGMAAHDIRAPLVAISGFAELITDQYVTDKEAIDDTVHSIHRISRHALDLLNNILDAASIESGVIDLEAQDIELDALLEDRVNFMNEIARRKAIKGTFVNKVTNRTPPVAHCDRQRISQVIDNILSNAIKYSPKGSAFELVLDEAVEGWLIQVCDTGPGIPKDELLGIFDEFGKTSVQATGGERSTGLGLSISQKLIVLHGGTIWIDSCVGEGTTVSIILPRRN